jgi:hypothetical protein
MPSADFITFPRLESDSVTMKSYFILITPDWGRVGNISWSNKSSHGFGWVEFRRAWHWGWSR